MFKLIKIICWIIFAVAFLLWLWEVLPGIVKLIIIIAVLAAIVKGIKSK